MDDPILTDPPLQIATVCVGECGGIGITLTISVSVLLQPPSFPAVTMYCVVVIGVATGLAILGFDSPVPGLQV